MMMDDFKVSVNICDYQTLLLFHQNLQQDEECLQGCETDDTEVTWTRYVLDSVLIPIVGVGGIVGNLISILVFALFYEKTTFKHVRSLLFDLY